MWLCCMFHLNSSISVVGRWTDRCRKVHVEEYEDQDTIAFVLVDSGFCLYENKCM